MARHHLQLTAEGEVQGQGAAGLAYAREYVAKVEGELQKIRDGILALMDKELISPPGTDELKVLYYKMKSDYHRYLAEYATDDAKGKATESACVAHVEANKIAENDLAVTHPIRLAMALNSSVFQADVFENTDEACEMTRVAFDDAITAPVIDIPAVTQQTLDVPMSEMVTQLVEVPKTPEITGQNPAAD